MELNLGRVFTGSHAKDPSWDLATKIVGDRLYVPTHVWQAFRNAWTGNADPREFFKVIAFSSLRPQALISAAELHVDNTGPSASTIETALCQLGLRLSAVVLGVNYASSAVLSQSPIRLWRPLFERIMTEIEIGYRIGAKCQDIGIEGGALIGFSISAGYAYLLAYKPKAFREWYNATRGGLQTNSEIEVDMFGCEGYQVGALVLQALGFGHEIAIGSACGGGKLRPKFISKDSEIMRWKAAFEWTEALALGRNHPGTLEIKNFFRELTPPMQYQTTGKNLILEVLYTEISRLRSSGSAWTWHLPRSGYEETQLLIGSQQDARAT